MWLSDKYETGTQMFFDSLYYFRCIMLPLYLFFLKVGDVYKMYMYMTFLWGAFVACYIMWYIDVRALSPYQQVEQLGWGVGVDMELDTRN